MRGVVTNRHVIRHAVLVVRVWGLRTFLRALFSRGTFLGATSWNTRKDISLRDPQLATASLQARHQATEAGNERSPPATRGLTVNGKYWLKDGQFGYQTIDRRELQG